MHGWGTHGLLGAPFAQAESQRSEVSSSGGAASASLSLSLSLLLLLLEPSPPPAVASCRAAAYCHCCSLNWRARPLAHCVRAADIALHHRRWPLRWATMRPRPAFLHS